MNGIRYSGKKAAFAFLAVLIIILAVAGAIYILERVGKESEAQLVIISYTSFSEWGLGPWAEEEFEELYDINVTIDTNYGDVGQVINAIDKGGVDADLVIGIDNSMLRTAVELDLLDTYRPGNIDRVDPGLIFDPQYRVIPYDYGYIAIICNSEMMDERGLPYPGSVMDLADNVYRDQLMLLDPTMSSTGSSFLIWAASVAGEQLDAYLEDLSENAYNVFQSWDIMYNAFMEGEAPMAISYGLDTASEIQYYGETDTVTVVPEEEGYRQIEGAGILKGARNRENAELFLEFMLSDQFQSRVGYNVMLPVVPTVEVDEVYMEHGEFAEQHVEPGQDTIMESYDEWLSSWESAFY
ncbi:MAG: thiamine ABC transporter substrate-binding protein [Thermoplasmatota archaeon]